MSLRRVCLFLCLLTLPALAQEFRATLQGTVTDPSHAAVQGATVTLKNLANGIERGGTGAGRAERRIGGLPGRCR